MRTKKSRPDLNGALPEECEVELLRRQGVSCPGPLANVHIVGTFWRQVGILILSPSPSNDDMTNPRTPCVIVMVVIRWIESNYQDVEYRVFERNNGY